MVLWLCNGQRGESRDWSLRKKVFTQNLEKKFPSPFHDFSTKLDQTGFQGFIQLCQMLENCCFFSLPLANIARIQNIFKAADSSRHPFALNTTAMASNKVPAVLSHNVSMAAIYRFLEQQKYLSTGLGISVTWNVHRCLYAMLRASRDISKYVRGRTWNRVRLSPPLTTTD